MNEQIKQLAEQAYQWAVNESKGGPNICAPGSDYFLAMEKKKFAELILQDIHRKVIASILITDVVMEEKGQVPTSEDYIRAIQKHFGVE